MSGVGKGSLFLSVTQGESGLAVNVVPYLMSKYFMRLFSCYQGLTTFSVKCC